jgi:hypothetical protein
MRSLLVVALLITHGPSPPQQCPTGAFCISISSAKTEHSKDSSVTTETIRIVGSQAVYEAERRRAKPQHREYKLTESEIAKLRKLAAESGLLTPSTVEYPAEAGSHTYLELSAEITLNEKKSVTEVSGSLNSENLKMNKSYQAVTVLLDAIKELLAAKDDEQHP